MRRSILSAAIVVIASLIAYASTATGTTQAGAESIKLSNGKCGLIAFAAGQWVVPGVKLDVYSNGSDEGTGSSCAPGTSTVNGVVAGAEWQSAELINRLYLTKGWITSTWTGDTGQTFYDDAPENLSEQPNGSVAYLDPGDVVIANVFYRGSDEESEELVVNEPFDTNSGAVNLVTQNSGLATNYAPNLTGTLINGSVAVGGADRGWSYTTIGVVHAPIPPTSAPTVSITTSSRGETIAVAPEPDALVRDGADIWVASCSGNAVDEINPTSKRVIKSLSGPGYALDCPDALAVAGPSIWVANAFGNSLTEFNASTGAWMKTLSGSDIFSPGALAVAGSELWVTDNSQVDNADSFISEFHTSSGSVVRTITTLKDYKFVIGSPTCLAIAGSVIWYSDLDGEAAEFRTDSGALVRNISTASVGCISYHSGDVWFSRGYFAGSDGVEEYRSATGAYVRTINTLPEPNELVFTGHDLFVETQSPVDTVREYSAAGRFLRTVVRSNKGDDRGIAAILVDGNRLWTANYSTSSVTESNI